MRIGLDIGGTKVAAVLLDDSGRVLAESWHEHHARGVEAVAAELVATAVRLTDSPEIHAIGVSVSGLVSRAGDVTGGASLEVFGDLAGAISERLGNPVRVFNDGEATLRSVVAAHREQSGDDVPDAVLLTVGTGIGGAILSDGRPVRGNTGLATELGHLPVQPPTAERCVCGSSGCLEQYAGGKGVADQARVAIRVGRASTALRERDEAAPGGITTRDVVALAQAGDASALALLEQAAVSIATAIRALCVTIEPGIVFLGGTVAHGASDILPDRIRHHLTQLWPFADLTTPPPVQLDAIGPYAGAIGAALLTRDLDHTTTDDASVDFCTGRHRP